jgi:hypothetical protein
MKGKVLALMLLAGACTSGESGPTKVEAEPKPPVSLPVTNAKVVGEIEAEVSSREILNGPDQSASPEQRRAVVLAILTDGTTASHLPLDAGR